METKYEPLSGADLLMIYHKLGGKGVPNIIKYNEMEGKTLEQILGSSGKAIILFMNSDNFGHWCALYRNKNGINFFDSYGTQPDKQYDFIPNHISTKLNGHIRKLTRMLYQAKRSGIPVNYNEYELQNWNDKRVATCGRWCVTRIAYPDISVDDFDRIFKGKSMSPDDIVAELAK